MIGGKKAAIAAAAVVVVTASSIGIATAANADKGEVIRVIDGDTLVVAFDDEELTVRLLNVDTPETKDPNAPVECLGPEATDFLTEALPAGSTVTLAFDVEREDRYGRTLAAVYDADDRLINAEIARAGLGIPVTYEPNAKFRPPVDEAYQEARDSGSGLFGADVECTVPALVDALEQTAAEAAEEGTGATAAAAAAAVAAVLALEKTLDESFDVLEAAARDSKSMIWTALSATEKSALTDRATAAKTKIHAQHDELIVLQQDRQAAEDEVQRKAAEAERQAAEEAARVAAVAAQAEADRIAAEQAEANRIAAETEARRVAAAQAEAERQAYVPPAPQYVPPVQGGNTSYTGPRCYAPGGKTWRPC